MKTKLLSLLKNKHRRVIVISLLMIFNVLLFSATNTKAGNGWVIGDTSKISRIPPPTTFGTKNWILPESTVFLLSPYSLPTFAVKDGQTKMMKEFQNTVPGYTDATVAIIPYDLGVYIKSKNFINNDLSVVKRADGEDSLSLNIISTKEQMKAVLMMDESGTVSEGFTKGVYYDGLAKLQKNGTLKSKWKTLISGTDSVKDAISKCEKVWSYITKFDDDKNVRKFKVSERIDMYLHIKELKVDPNKVGDLDPKVSEEFKLRYIDFLMTVYTQVRGSVAESKWESAIIQYINGISNMPENECNIAITVGFAARGEAEVGGKIKFVNIISGCQDFIDATFGIDKEYTLTNRKSADKIADSLTKNGKSATYYDRLLESLRQSVVKQVKNKEEVVRTYATDSLFGSNIVARLVEHKPNINGTLVSWKSGVWNEADYIEHIYLKSKYYGTLLVPAYNLASIPVETKAVLKVASTIAPGQNPVEVIGRNILNDEPKLNIYLDGKKESEKWNLLFESNQYYKVQVTFTRTPSSPSINIFTKDYVSKAKTIDEKVLKSQLMSGKISLGEWVDKSLLAVVINDGQKLKYTYSAKVTIFYSNTTQTVDDMNKVEVTTNLATITYVRKEPPKVEKGHYISEASSYSELKEGTIYNETFEAMAGVPTTRTLYFASGGSEFMVELEVEYDEDEKATRTYKSAFASNDCEFKEGDTAPSNMTLGDQAANLHGGGIYTKTWTGPIPNDGASETKKHTATSVAVPNYSAYNAAKTVATAFATQVNGTVLSYTSASDKKTRNYNTWNAGITTDSTSPPQNVTATVPCDERAEVSHTESSTDSEGNTTSTKVIDSAAIPCHNEMATANKSGAGSYTITVTWTVPAHVICGPCCTHVLPAVEDTWKQDLTFDTLKIIDVRVWKIESSYVDGMEEITYTPDSTVKATIKQGDPNIFYNIATANTSQAGRLRYSLQQQQHDVVTWYENNSSGVEKRSNKCNGLSGTLCSSNPIPVAANQGHLNTWAKGILYSNSGYTNDLNHQEKAYSGVKNVSSGDSTDTVDKQTEEYNRFTTRRNMPNKATVVSDMLILQTSSGDQAAVYFEASQTKKAQENYDDINITFAQMWTNNILSAAKWSKDEINIGSYNGEYYHTTTKYKGDGDGARIATAFDNDISKVSSGDELNLARVVSTKSFGAGAENKSTPSLQYRMTRPSELRLLIDGIKQNPINPNGQYFANQSYVYFKNILSYTNASSATGMANYHELTTNDLGDYGYTMKSSYKVSEGKEGTVNSIVVQNPISVEDAMIISLPSEMDQRTTLPAGSAQSLLEKISASEVCPLSPGLCEFRVHNCKYGTDIIISSFNFEKISTKALSDPVSGIEEPIVEGVGTDDNNLVFENFTTNYELLDITSSGCTVSNSLERLVVAVDEENSYVELGVNVDTSDITTVRVSFGTSGKSAKSYLSYSTEKDGTYRGNVEKAIDSAAINQTVEYNVGALSSWRELGTVKRLRINLDGDNIGTGTYIITKIELVPDGLNTGGEATFSGSEDDTSLIRSLIVPSSERVMEYKLTSGFTIDKNSVFGTGRSLNASGNGGTRLAIPLGGIGISYQRATNLKMEANLYLPAISGTDNMLFSFYGIGFYVPSGKDCGYFITSEGAIKRADSVIVGSKLKLGVVFSFGSISECKIYVNDILVTSYTTINNGGETAGGISEDMIGDTLNIGCWSKDNSYSAKFTIDNLTVTKMAGSRTHTAACYTTFIDHSYSKNYTCDQTQEFTYTGSVQAFTAPENGTYKLEAWGAQGGYNYGNYGNSGEGGFSSGEVYLKKGQTIQVYVGAQGANGSSPDYTGGAFNGGGAGMDEGLTADGHQGGQGGGATDFRLPEGNIIASTDPYIGKFANLIYSGNLSKVTLNTGENSIKLARGSTHTAAALANVFRAGHTYQISFEAWTSSTSDTIYADAYPDSLPDYIFNISNTRKLYTATISSPLAALEGAAFRLFAGSFALNGDVYITNIKVCDTSLSTTTATYAIGTGLIDSGSITYGPFANMLSGTYQIDIYGTNLASCTVDTISRGGATSYTITNINKTKTHITYYVNITEDIIKDASQSGLEIRIFHSGISGYSVTKQTISRLEDRILVAAGGGGTGCASTLIPAGDGGGLVGGTTWNSYDYYLGYQASGGTQSYGGIGMRDNVPLSGILARTGGFGYGADASQCGAGGGGGWYGGGSSYTGGGGGGSSYIGGVDKGSTLASVRRGEGYARITNLTHTHGNECAYTVGENNTHSHNASCINSSSLALVNALMLAENGSFNTIKAMLGNTVYNSLRLTSQVIYTWNNWSPADLKQFRALNHTKLSTSGDNLIITNTGTDPYIDVPVNVIASSVNKVRLYARLVGVTSPNSYLFFTNETYPNYTGSAMAIDNINADNNWQWIEFDLEDNSSWTGKISSLRFDIVGNDAGTGYVEIDQIQLIGNGSSVDGTTTKVLYEYSGFSNARKFGITDDVSTATTVFDNNCVVTSGNLSGWDFMLPVNINNADALTAIRITLSNWTNSTSLGVSTDRGTEYFAGMTSYDGGVYQTVTIDTSGMSGSISNLYFDIAAGAANGTTYVSKIELIGYGNLTTEPTEKYVPGVTPGSQDFYYTGSIQYFTAQYTATYIFETYGAQGGGAYGSAAGKDSVSGGLGGYSKSVVSLTKGQTAYVYVGGRGGNAPTSNIDGYNALNNNGGYNGGGSGAGSCGPGGGGATDIRVGGVDFGNRVVVAAGGGGDAVNASTIGSSGSAPVSNSVLGFGSNGPTGWSGSYEYDTGGGGGGYYGGQSVAGDDPRYAYAGTNYCSGTGSTFSYGVNTGHGFAKISWTDTNNPPIYEYTPGTITYVAPKVVQTTAFYGFGSLNGTQAGIDATIATIANLYNSIPYSVNGAVNPIWGCNFTFNTHICDSNCKEVTILTCNEPHHFGICYDYDNEICWDACGNDANHKHAQVTETEAADGSRIHVGTFICLDNYFQVYFPNNGDFYGNGAYGIENTTIYRGKGYVNNMPTLEWLREKRVRFGYDVLFNRNGVWEAYGAGEWITLPIRSNSGSELNYYDFYCILANNEKIAASVEFQAEAINCISSPGGKEDPYLGDDYADTDCSMDSPSGYMTNKERFMSLWAFHSAYKQSYTDVVGRIGNLIVEDTEDFRYSNFFKRTLGDGWIVDGIIRKVNTDISNNYLSWFKNDGSFGKDIRGVTVSKATNMYDTYGTQSWTGTANSVSLPLQGAINTVTSLTDCQLKLGYNILFDISTIGDYQNNLQVVPYFYALNLDTNMVTPVDVYISMDKEYKPINYFGLMSEYVDANNNYTAEYYTLKDQLYDYVMNLDWDNEARRRNYTSMEEANTKLLGENTMEPVTDPSGTILTYKYLTIPYGNYYSLGTLQMLLPGVRARTFIGSSKVNTVSINEGSAIDKHETNIGGKFINNLFLFNGQRWHLTLGVPSSAIFVPYRNKRHILPTEEVVGADGREIAAYEEFKNGNYVILMTADIKAIGRKYVLGFDQGANNGVLRIKGKSYSFGADLPNVFAVYDAEGSAVSDIDFTGTH